MHQNVFYFTRTLWFLLWTEKSRTTHLSAYTRTSKDTARPLWLSEVKCIYVNTDTDSYYPVLSLWFVYHPSCEYHYTLRCIQYGQMSQIHSHIYTTVGLVIWQAPDESFSLTLSHYLPIILKVYNKGTTVVTSSFENTIVKTVKGHVLTHYVGMPLGWKVFQRIPLLISSIGLTASRSVTTFVIQQLHCPHTTCTRNKPISSTRWAASKWHTRSIRHNCITSFWCTPYYTKCTGRAVLWMHQNSLSLGYYGSCCEPRNCTANLSAHTRTSKDNW